MIGRSAFRYYKELKKTQWLSPEKIREIQDIKLRNLIRHAYDHVPYYRDIFQKRGLGPHDIGSIEDLKKLPFLSRDDVRNGLFSGLMSDNHKKDRILRVGTGGTTAEPLHIYCDKRQLEHRWANTLRNMEWIGYRFGDRHIRLWHCSSFEMDRIRFLKQRIDNIMSNRRFIPIFEMSDRLLERYVDLIMNFRPVLLDGYAESFNLMASFLRARSIKGVSVKAIISSAQVLPDEGRRLIEGGFNCKVYNKYGSREFSGIAHECECHTGLHVNAESYIVEIIKDNRPARPGELGEIVITDLNNYCLPFIRYRLEDLGYFSDRACPCGRGLPMIEKIEGRVQSIIIGSKNRYLPGTFFYYLSARFAEILRQIKVVQTRFGEMDLYIIKSEGFKEAMFKEMLGLIKGHLGEDLKIVVNFVDKIPLTKLGKQQVSLSTLKLDFQKMGHE